MIEKLADLIGNLTPAQLADRHELEAALKHGINMGELAISSILSLLGENPERDGLKDTPKRVVKSWREIYGGYREDPKEILTRQFEKDGYNQVILLKNCEFYSTCEHHMQPFFGRAHIGYIPGGKVVGISKLARLLDCYARRLQIQERLTQQIAAAMKEHLEPKGIVVCLEAKHFCMVCRGVEKQGSSMVTSAVEGVFMHNPAARAEVFDMMR